MKKSDLIKKLSEQSDLPLEKAAKVVNTFFRGIEEALIKGQRVEIRNFGVFTIREKRAYKGHNPQTGEPVNVPSSKHPHFRAGTELKERLNS